MLAQPPASPSGKGSSLAAGHGLTAVLVDDGWSVECWLVGSGAEATEWPVAGESFWELTEGRIPVEAASTLRAAMASRRPDLLMIVDPLSGEPIHVIVTPTMTGLTIIFQPAGADDTEIAVAGNESTAAKPSRDGLDHTAGAEPGAVMPSWLQTPFQKLIDARSVDQVFQLAVEGLVGAGGSPRVALGLVSGERLLIVHHTGYGLIDLLRPLSDPGLQQALLSGEAVRVDQADPVSWIAEDSRVAIHAPFRWQADGGPGGILTVEWSDPRGGTPTDLMRIAAFAECLSLAVGQGPLAGTLFSSLGSPSGALDAVGATTPIAAPDGFDPTAPAIDSLTEWEPSASGKDAPPAPNRIQMLKTRRWDPDTGRWPITGMSDRIAELSGFGGADLLSDPELWSSRVHHDDRSLVQRSRSLAPEPGQRSHAVYRFQRRDGEWRVFQEDAVVFRDAAGELINDTLIVDVTGQQDTVDLLRESEMRYRYLVDELPGVVAYIREYDPRFGTLRTTYVSPEVEALTGVPADRWIGDNLAVMDMVHPDDLDRVQAASAAVVERHADFTHEYRIVRPDGQIRWLRNRVKAIAKSPDAGTDVERWHGVMIDITSQREAELALRDREARFRLLVEQSPSATLYTQQVDPATGDVTTSYLSPQVVTLTGYDPADVPDLEPPFLALVHPDDRELVLSHLPGQRLTDGRFNVAYRITDRTGRTRWVRNMVQRDDQPAADGTETWRGIVIDVTDQWVAAQAARARDARVRSIVEQASEILIITDQRGMPAFVSPAFEAILGYPLEGQADVTLASAVHPDQLDDLSAEIQRVYAAVGNRFSGMRVKAAHADGSWRWLEVSAINKRDLPEIGGIVITARDVTDQVLAEESLRFRESLLGTLVRHAADFIVVVTADLVMIYASPSAMEFLGEPDPTSPLAIRRSLFQEDDRDRFVTELRRLEGHPGAEARVEAQLLRADGQWRWITMVITNHTETLGIHGYLINAHDTTDQREAEKRLRDSEDRFRALFRFAPDIVMVLDPDGYVLFASPSVELALGDSIRRFVDREAQLNFHPDDNAMAIAQFDRALENPSEGVSFEARVRHRSGIWLWWEITVTNLLAHASIGGLVMNARDVTWRKDAEGLLRESEERFRSLVQHGSDLTMLVSENGMVSFVTPSSLRILGFAPSDIEGKADFDWISHSDRSRFDDLLEQSRRRPEPAGPIVVSFRHADGSWRDLQIIATSLLDNRNVRGIVVNAHDVTERRTLEQQLLHQAFHDPLTGLPNRSLFNERLTEARRRARQNDTSFAVIFMDLDDFKVVNDTLGHSAGDQLLRTVADRLTTIARGDDTVARMGGDEFTILIEDLRDVASAEAFADRVIQRLQEPVTITGHEVMVSPCLGIAIGRPDDDDDHDLLREADIAMYEAKARGKGQQVVYNDHMTSQVWARMQIQSELHHAIGHDQLRVHYQPQVELATGRITEFEALVRWEHPTRGLISPHEFITVAEETGMIVPLGQYVLEQACAMAWAWNRQRREHGLDDLMISVNLSARQFLHPSLVEDVAAVLLRTGLEAGLLRLEVTESVALNDFTATVRTMRALRQLGVRLTIDDFGTGYSGLNYLRDCPIDTIKIDRSYIGGLGTDSSDTAMIHAVMAFATTLGLNVCAEGIEREEQVQQLRAVGCHRGQGFYFSGPLPGETITAMLASDPVWALGFWSTHDVASTVDPNVTVH
jgi:diguanylate cyclase (GGDEF)-like protein/PAS domain S-box-containing protein